MSSNETKFSILFKLPLFFYVHVNMDSTFISTGGKGNCYKIRVELRKRERKKERKGLFGRPRCRWKVIVRLKSKDAGWERAD
jgi:hypothetical protein